MTKSWKTPTPEKVRRAVSLLSNPWQQMYFFSKLENPGWLTLLRAEGVFSTPPGPVPNPTEGTVSLPAWPALRYLVRMAARPEAQPEVASILQTIPSTDNPRVHADIVDALLSLPVGVVVGFVPRVREWMGSSGSFLNSERIVQLIDRLAGAGQPNAAFRLASGLLAVRRDPRDEGSPADGERRFLFGPLPYLRDWEYGKAVQASLRILSSVDAPRTVRFFAGLLTTALRYSGSEDAPSEHSYYWRPAIEDSPQNEPLDIKDVLVDALRDALVTAKEKGAISLPELISTLEARSDTIFHRLALYLLGLYAAEAPALVAERLADPKRLDDVELRHEHFHLARLGYSYLPPEAKEEFLAAIDRGPDRAKVGSALSREGHEVSEELITKYSEVWRLRRIAAVADRLAGSAKSEYERLTRSIGSLEHPDFPVYFSQSAWMEPQSPIDLAELRQKGDDEVITFLRGWKQEVSWGGPSREGLAEVLGLLLRERPTLLGQADSFRGVHPAYVETILRTAGDLLKADLSNRAPILALTLWATTQHSENAELEKDWQRSRHAAADLVSSILQADTAASLDLRPLMWDILTRLLADPDPDTDRDSQPGDPSTRALNSIRGRALESVFRYAFWLRKAIGPPNLQGVLRDWCPEIIPALLQRLNPEHEKSPAVRAMFGRFFPQLVFLDEGLGASLANSLFPLEGPHAHLGRAAWEGYVVFNQPTPKLYGLLRQQYALANEAVTVEAAEKQPDYYRPADPHRRLGEHLATLFWQKAIESKPLIDAYLDRGGERLQTTFVSFVGHSLASSEVEIPADIADRLIALGNHMLSQGRRWDLSYFGWWFASGKLDQDWSLDAVRRVLALGMKIEPDHVVVERLAKIADSYPRPSVELLNQLIDLEKEEWAIGGYKDEARKILAAAMSSGDKEAARVASQTIERLGRRGHMEFGALISPKAG